MNETKKPRGAPRGNTNAKKASEKLKSDYIYICITPHKKATLKRAHEKAKPGLPFTPWLIEVLGESLSAKGHEMWEIS